MSEEPGLLPAVMGVVMAERESRLAGASRTLHDQIGQILSVVGLRLDLLRMDLRASIPDIDARSSEIQRLLEQVVENVRELSSALDPELTERVGLTAAVRRMARCAAGDSGATIEVRGRLPDTLEPRLAHSLHQLADFALHYLLSCSNSGRISIRLSCSDGRPSLEIRRSAAGVKPAETGPAGELALIAVLRVAAEAAGIELGFCRGRGGSLSLCLREPASEALQGRARRPQISRRRRGGR
jgi:signal transduction histidine kinase